jgi:hypothetical protein
MSIIIVQCAFSYQIDLRVPTDNNFKYIEPQYNSIILESPDDDSKEHMGNEPINLGNYQATVTASKNTDMLMGLVDIGSMSVGGVGINHSF